MFNAYSINTLEYNAQKCVGCSRCIEVCPHAVFESGINGDRAVILAHGERCMECGACMVNCPTDAIRVLSGAGCAMLLMYQALKGKEPDFGCDGECGGE